MTNPSPDPTPDTPDTQTKALFEARQVVVYDSEKVDAMAETLADAETALAEIARTLHPFRTGYRMSRSTLSNSSGVPEHAIAVIENGTRPPTLPEARALLDTMINVSSFR